tara:strand:- start:1 stop:645 length:645 start_codon:yes stop_codon:yes gene_type:complete
MANKQESGIEIGKPLETVDIKGKPYVMVSTRIQYFREIFPRGTIETSIHHFDDTQCIVTARVYPDKTNYPEWYADGMAQEYIGASHINKTSWLEVGSTSAIGRAMAMMGIGISHGVASADEVRNAKQIQSNDSFPQRTKAFAPTNNQLKELADAMQYPCFTDEKRQSASEWLAGGNFVEKTFMEFYEKVMFEKVKFDCEQNEESARAELLKEGK